MPVSEQRKPNKFEYFKFEKEILYVKTSIIQIYIIQKQNIEKYLQHDLNVQAEQMKAEHPLLPLQMLFQMSLCMCCFGCLYTPQDMLRFL